MALWRVKWAFGQLRDREAFPRYSQELSSPSIYWVALFLKLIPVPWRRPITFRLRRGGQFLVREFMSLYIFREIFVDGCYDLPRLRGEQPIIVDIGANTGLFAIRMKQLYPAASIWCYEPLPENFRSLTRNLELSGLSGCHPFQEGVGNSARTEKLFVHQRNVGGHSIFADVASSSESITISLVDLGTVLARVGDKAIDLLKLDCEGAEYEILKSMNVQTAQRIERIVFEPTPSRYDIGEVKAHLASIGYRVVWNDGIYIASRADLVE